MTVIVAMLIAAIGMTGFAAAGSAMDYDITFDGNGDGSMDIRTTSPVGFDAQVVGWTNCEATGRQRGNYGDSKWMKVDRKTTITGIQNGDEASGFIATKSQMISPGSVDGGYIETVATYYDDKAYGSYISVKQGTTLYDGDMVAGDTGYEYIDVNTWIAGYAYGDNRTRVSGSVQSVTDGRMNASTGIGATVHDGRLKMTVDSLIRDEIDDDETSKTAYGVKVRSSNYTSDGFVIGHSSVNGVSQDTMLTVFENADVTATGYFYAVDLNSGTEV